MRKRPLLWFACVFLLGLAYERYHRAVFLPVVLGFLFCEIWQGWKNRQKKKIVRRSVMLIVTFLCGMMHMHTETEFRDAYMSRLTDGDTVVVLGEISKIENTDYGIRMILTDCYVRINQAYMPCNDVMVYASFARFQVGEIHKVTGKLNMFAPASNQGAFDGKTFYQSQKIDFSVKMEHSDLLGTTKDPLQAFLIGFREKLKGVYAKVMDEDAAGFFSAMLLGDKTGLSDEIQALFVTGGISHILAISGLYVSMIGRNMYRILRKCGVGFGVAGGLAGFVLLAYGSMVGNGMSAVRAIGMMLLFFFGQWLGRSYDMLNSLGAMVLYLLWENPFLLEYSGFWFSVMAILGVGTSGTVFADALPKGTGMSLGITLATLPVVAYCYYEIPMCATLVNAVALPMLTPMFLLALLGGIVGLMFLPLAKALLFPCGLGLEFYIRLCRFLKHLPFVSVICGQAEELQIVIYYLVLAVGVLWIQRQSVGEGKRLPPKYWAALIVSVLCFGVILFPKEKPCEVTFLDVGQGDGIYISTGEGVSYFIDGGSSSEKAVGEYQILPFLKSKGVKRVDYWFVSHADNDHISGLLEVMESGYPIANLVLSEHAPADENQSRLIACAKENDIPVIFMDAGEKIKTAHTNLSCLYPWDDTAATQENRNDASLVLLFEATDPKTQEVSKVWLAGDISAEVEKELLLAGCVDKVDLYKASHHGSQYSNSEELLAVLQPETAVISCAKENTYGHPHEETIRRLEAAGVKISYTMQSGQVRVLLLQSHL